ncbi:hypothetical protein IJU97_01715 [bacterium]|nr:hypothetical protein [bacterium]
MTLANGKTAYFKLVIDGAVEPLERFTVKDKLDDSKLLFSDKSRELENNLFT